MSRLLAPALVVALAVSIAAGCGGDDDEAETTPASVVPADSLLYMDALVRPEGEERTAIEAPLAALLGTEDPGAVIIDALNAELAEDGATYEEDIAPWLGERAGIFFTSVFPPEAAGDVEGTAFDDAEGAFVVETTDPDAAMAFAEKFADDGDAFEIVDDFLVGGTEDAVQAAVDAAEGDSLEDDGEFDSLLGAETAATGRLFADVPGFVAAAKEAGELTAEDGDKLDAVLSGFLDEPATAVLQGETTGVAVEVSYGNTGDSPLAAGEESALLRELPEDTWLAAGLPDVGELVEGYLGTAEQLGSAEGLDEVSAEFREELGVEPAELFGPLGDGALFATGSGIFGTGGGLVFETSDPDAGRDLIAALERAAKRGGEDVRPLSGGGGEGFAVSVSNIPGAINFVASDDRVVIAYGEAAAAAALDPSMAEGALADSEAFAEAQGALGSDYAVSAYFDFGPVVGLLDLAAATDPALQEAVPYLESLDYLVAGSTSDGERERHRVFLGVADIVADPSA